MDLDRAPSIITKFNVDGNGNPISVSKTETQQVHSTKNVIESNIMDEFHRVEILNKTMYEVNNLDEVNSSNQYYVDYNNGRIYFHSSLKGQSVQYRYGDVGKITLSANNVFTKVNDLGEIIEYLSDFIERVENKLEELEEDLDTYKEVLDEVKEAEDLMDRLNKDVADGKVLQPILHQDVIDARDIKTKLDKSVEDAQDDIATIEATGNETKYITSNQWTLNSTSKMYEYTLTHQQNSKALTISCYNTDTDEFVFVGGKILDKNRILFELETAINLTVVINSRYYKPQMTLNSEIQEEVVEARKGKVDLKAKITEIDDKIASNSASLDSKAKQVDLETQKARMDSFTSLAEGSTTGDAELIDGRVSADGRTYKNIGGAIRSVGITVNSFYNKKIGKNLFDKSKFKPNTEIKGSTGLPFDSANPVGISDYIQVQQGKKVCFSINGSQLTAFGLYAICEYDSSDNYIKKVTASDAGYIYTVPVGVSSIIITINNSLSTGIQVEYDGITSYEPYGEITELKSTNIDNMKNEIDRLSGVSSNPLDRILEGAGLLNCFLKVGCIGDSLDSGCCVYKRADGVEEGIDMYQYSWGQYLARITGNKYFNFSRGGLTTRTWLTSSYGAVECYKEANKCDAYIISLGQNDKNNNETIGSISDIDKANYNNNADTYYGRLAKIIQKCFELQPKAKIFLCTDPISKVESAGYNKPVRDIANLFDNVYLLDLYQYGSELWDYDGSNILSINKRSAHFSAVGYYMIARYIASYINWIIENNPLEFREIEFIGTDYKFY